jgi:uncharacterized membrane protein
MKLLRLLFKPETFAPMMALVFASAVSIVLVMARVVFSKNIHYAFLIWNLLLAWLPLLFALLACDQLKEAGRPGWRFGAFTAAWLLFFPNAPYILTDLTHLRVTLRLNEHTLFWVDLSLILTCALTGLVIGFVSLYLMQALVRRRFGTMLSWVFIAAIAALSSFGICVGRFLRFNSWDPVVKPGEMYESISSFVLSLANPGSIAFPVLFATFLFTAYLMLYALTHLSPAQLPAASERP